MRRSPFPTAGSSLLTRFGSLALFLVLGFGPVAAQTASEPLPGIEAIEIEVGDFTFDGLVAGPEAGELVLLLHGFPQSAFEWRAQLVALGEAGYRAVAPNQRGYAPGARPEAVEDYAYDLLIGDVLAMADALEAESFHLVGHDWGAGIAWGVAARAPDRVTTLSVFSIPHPGALDAQIADPASCQYAASSYFDFLVTPDNEPAILANNAAILRSFYSGLELEPVAAYVALLGTVPALRAALNWYRANIAEGRRFLAGRLPGPVSVPTLFVWSSGDAAVCRESAEGNAEFVTGPYLFEVIEGVGHYIPDEAPDQVTALLLEQIGAAQ